MSDQHRSRHPIFGGLVLILLGALFLIQNFRPEFQLWDLLLRWWPLLLILLGIARLIDYALAHRAAVPDAPPPRVVSGGDIFLIVAVIALIAVAGGIYKARQKLGDADFWSTNWGNPYVFTEQVSSPEPLPANARIDVSDVRGDISIHAEDRAEILVTVKKTVSEFSQSDAQRRADAIHFLVVDNHDGSYEIMPQQQGSDSRRMQTDLDIHVPQRASVSATTEQGNVDIASVGGVVEATTRKGNLNIRDAGGDVTAATDHGDVQVTGAGGNVRLSGKGNEVSVSSVQGEVDIDGDFYGPIRLSQVAKGARLTSKRTDLNVTTLAGSLEVDSGNVEIENSPGSVNVSTQKSDVTIENTTGSIDVDDHDGDVDVRFAQLPREPVNITNGSGNVSVTLPAKSNFQMDAESDSGDANSEFSGIAPRKEGDRSILAGQAGTRGPMIHIRTTYGDISLHKGS
ncbi:MAG: DUF4097 family beta strand repeat-containing protein [Candidatus Acidiferrales bacterium]